MGDFGLGRNFTPGDSVSPFPRAPLSFHQPDVFSSGNYDHIDDLRSVGQLMEQLLATLTDTGYAIPHPNPRYAEISLGLRSRRYNQVTEPLYLANYEHEQMTMSMVVPYWCGNGIGTASRSCT